LASNLKRVLVTVMALGLLLQPPLALAQFQEEQDPSQVAGEDQVPVEGEETLFQGGDVLEPEEGLEAAISGGEYKLGPGDVLVINIWGARPVNYRLAVTLEGKLLIPNVGSLYVNNLLLSDAKEVIREEMLRYYRK
jgi:protein involved in polysaccharide export with SLBB domain